MDPKALPQYWVVLDSQGQAQIYRPRRDAGDLASCQLGALLLVRLRPVEGKIAAPALGPPVDDKTYGFYDTSKQVRLER